MARVSLWQKIYYSIRCGVKMFQSIKTMTLIPGDTLNYTYTLNIDKQITVKGVKILDVRVKL